MCSFVCIWFIEEKAGIIQNISIVNVRYVLITCYTEWIFPKQNIEFNFSRHPSDMVHQLQLTGLIRQWCEPSLLWAIQSIIIVNESEVERVNAFNRSCELYAIYFVFLASCWKRKHCRQTDPHFGSLNFQLIVYVWWASSISTLL